ncbi:hypothetical protein D3C72_511270 [compost metagenome]
MAYDNAQMAAAWGVLLGLTPEQVETLQDDLDQWAMGGARLATWSRLATDLNLFNNAAVAMVHDWYGGTSTGGPNGDGLYPLMNSEGEVFLVPSPARLQADLTGFDPKGTLPSVGDLPASGEPGDLWIIGGDAWGWSARLSAWRNMGPFRGAQGVKGDTGAPGQDGEDGAPGANGADGADGQEVQLQTTATHIQWRLGPAGAWADLTPLSALSGADGADGREVQLQVSATHIQWRLVGAAGWTDLIARAALKGDRGDAFTVNAQGDLAGREAYDGEAVGFSYLDVENGNLYFRVAPSGWSLPIPFGKGEKGDKGDTGADGPEGPAGADGADGSDATVPYATVADFRAGTGAGVVTSETAAEAFKQVSVDAGTIAAGVDFSGFFSATITLTSNGTLGAPSNTTPGKSGTIFVSSAGFTLAYHASYRLPVGGITLQPTGLTCIPYLVGASGAVLLFPATKWGA